jgi:hypothetical protein
MQVAALENKLEELGGLSYNSRERGATTITPNRCSAQQGTDLMSHSDRSAAKARRARGAVMVD